MNVLFVAYYPGYVSLQSPTRCITLLSFYIPWSLLKVIIYVFFWKFKKKSVVGCHCRQAHIAANFPSLYRVYHGSQTTLRYFMFCIYIFCLFCCCFCHFRCFYCKMSSYGVNLVSLIHVCWKCALIRLLTIKQPCFSLKHAFEFMSDLGNPTINEIHFFFPTDKSTFGFSSVHRFAAVYEHNFYFFIHPETDIMLHMLCNSHLKSRQNN